MLIIPLLRKLRLLEINFLLYVIEKRQKGSLAFCLVCQLTSLLSIAVLTLVSSGSLIQRIRCLSKTRYRQMSLCAYVWHTEVQIESSVSIFSWFLLEILCMLFAKYEAGCHSTTKTDSVFYCNNICCQNMLKVTLWTLS